MTDSIYDRFSMAFTTGSACAATGYKLGATTTPGITTDDITYASVGGVVCGITGFFGLDIQKTISEAIYGVPVVVNNETTKEVVKGFSNETLKDTCDVMYPMLSDTLGEAAKGQMKGTSNETLKDTCDVMYPMLSDTLGEAAQKQTQVIKDILREVAEEQASATEVLKGTCTIPSVVEIFNDEMTKQSIEKLAKEAVEQELLTGSCIVELPVEIINTGTCDIASQQAAHAAAQELLRGTCSSVLESNVCDAPNMLNTIISGGKDAVINFASNNPGVAINTVLGGTVAGVKGAVKAASESESYLGMPFAFIKGGVVEGVKGGLKAGLTTYVLSSAYYGCEALTGVNPLPYVQAVSLGLTGTYLAVNTVKGIYNYCTTPAEGMEDNFEATEQDYLDSMFAAQQVEEQKKAAEEVLKGDVIKTETTDKPLQIEFVQATAGKNIPVDVPVSLLAASRNMAEGIHGINTVLEGPNKTFTPSLVQQQQPVVQQQASRSPYTIRNF